jgi:hypothetical protein
LSVITPGYLLARLRRWLSEVLHLVLGRLDHKRNRERFPTDFMFQVTRKEFENLKSQIVTSSWGGARRALPYAFTEHGILMLSTVLRSPRAIQVNIAIMRAFVSLRELVATNATLARKLNELEKKYYNQFKVVFG